ncbi:hypothetical protein DPMN_022345 [Dreissena polymorpha]|uniref:Uncharacterized protein n=1 Tax=Dreissena polymorpha TaxID=45954 RepID=A0A9D4SAQ7_DREPO|nr:hypothetical protein DPMN_022345 [Dreissena polymorpha]
MDRRRNQSLFEGQQSLKDDITSHLLRVHVVEGIILTGNKFGSHHCSRQSQ